jgi:hypothetical protein
VRCLKFSVVLLAALTPFAAHAALMSASFSGTLVASLGPVHAGDTFSGVATWDPASATPCGTNRTCASFTSYSFTMPAADGLNITSLPDPKVLFAGALYLSGVFSSTQVNERSSADNTVYVFGFNPTGAFFSNADFTQGISADPHTYRFVGPTAVPEPGTSVLIIAGLGLIVKLRHSFPAAKVRS